MYRVQKQDEIQVSLNDGFMWKIKLFNNIIFIIFNYCFDKYK